MIALPALLLLAAVPSRPCRAAPPGWGRAPPPARRPPHAWLGSPAALSYSVFARSEYDSNVALQPTSVAGGADGTGDEAFVLGGFLAVEPFSLGLVLSDDASYRKYVHQTSY